MGKKTPLKSIVVLMIGILILCCCMYFYLEANESCIFVNGTILGSSWDYETSTGTLVIEAEIGYEHLFGQSFYIITFDTETEIMDSDGKKQTKMQLADGTEVEAMFLGYPFQSILKNAEIKPICEKITIK